MQVAIRDPALLTVTGVVVVEVGLLHEVEVRRIGEGCGEPASIFFCNDVAAPVSSLDPPIDEPPSVPIGA